MENTFLSKSYQHDFICVIPFCFSFIVCCNNPAHGLPGYRLHNDKNGIISALLEYHCLLAAAAAATEAIDVTILELSDEDSDDRAEFSVFALSSSEHGGNPFELLLFGKRLSSEKEKKYLQIWIRTI